MKTQTTAPLTEATFFILLSYPQHPSTGTLYGAIRRLLEQGWIKRVADFEPNLTGRERKAYALTDKGRKMVKAELA